MGNQHDPTRPQHGEAHDSSTWGWRIGELERWRHGTERVLEERREKHDNDVRKVKGSVQTALRRIDALTVKVACWGASAAFVATLLANWILRKI